MAKQKRTVDSRGYVREVINIDGFKYDLRAKTSEALDKKILEKKVQHATNNVIVNKNTTVTEWSARWLEVYKKGKIVESHYEDIKRMLNKHILPVIGKYRLCDIKAVNLQMLLNQHEGKSKGFIKHINGVLYGMFDKAEVNDLITKNPARHVELPSGTYEGHRAITDHEREHILKAAETHYAGPYIKTMLYCGLRPAEACALTWDDIDFDKNIIHINKSLESGSSGRIKTPKTTAGIRNVPLPLLLKKDLLGLKLVSKSNYVFTTSTGLRITRTSMQLIWEMFKKAIDISMGAELTKKGEIKNSKVAKELRPYCLRHTYATDLQAAGVPMNVAKYLLGHEDITTTANIYTHTTDDIIESAREAQEKYLSIGTKNGTN